MPFFGFGDTGSSDGDGPRRVQDAGEEKSEEAKPITRASSPSGLSLEKLLVPDGMGTLEQISHKSEIRTTAPIPFFPSYLFFDASSPRSSFPYANPKYIVYSHLVQHDATPYAGTYATPDTAPEYFATNLYRPAAKPELYSPAADYSIPYVAPFSLLDSREQSYQRFVWNFFGTMPKALYKHSSRNENVQNFPLSARLEAYAGMPAYPNNTAPKSLQNTSLQAGKNPIAAFGPNTAYVSGQQPPSIQSKPAVMVYYGGTPKIPFQIREAGTFPKNPATLEADVINTYRAQNTSLHQAPHLAYYPALFSDQTNLQQKSHVNQPRLEAKIKAAKAQNNSYKKPQAVQIYAPANPIRNYDMPAPWINILSSNFWQANLVYLQEVKSLNKRKEDYTEKKDEKPAYKKTEQKEVETAEPKYEEAREIKQIGDKKKDAIEAKKQIEPAYEPKNKNETKEAEAPGADAEMPYSNGNGKKQVTEGNSVLTYAAAVPLIGVGAVAAGLAGLVNFASAFIDKPEEVKKSYSYQATTDNAEEPRKPEAKTIDSVVVPDANLNESHSVLINGLQNYLKKLNDLDYEKKGLVALDIKTRKPIFAYNEDVVMIEPSKIKPAIVLAVLYRAQQGLFDLNGAVPFRKELHLERETGVEEYIFERDGVKYIKVRDLFDLVIKRSNNTSGSLLGYALAQNGAFKIDQTSEEVVEQFEKGVDIYESVMDILGFPQMKFKGPFLNEEKAKELKFKATYKSNTATPIATAQLHASIREGDFLDEYHNGILKNLLENEETAAAQREILGEGAALKPSIHPYGAGISGSTKNISFDIGFDDSPVILYEKNVSTELRHLPRFYTPQAVKTNQFETEFIRIIKQGDAQALPKQTEYKKPI